MITAVLVRGIQEELGQQRRQCDDSDIETGVLCSEDGGRGHKPRKTGSHKKVILP